MKKVKFYVVTMILFVGLESRSYSFS